MMSLGLITLVLVLIGTFENDHPCLVIYKVILIFSSIIVIIKNSLSCLRLCPDISKNFLPFALVISRLYTHDYHPFLSEHIRFTDQILKLSYPLYVSYPYPTSYPHIRIPLPTPTAPQVPYNHGFRHGPAPNFS